MSKNFMNWDGSDSSQQTYLQTEILRELRGQGVPPGGYPHGAAMKGAGQFVVWLFCIFFIMWKLDGALTCFGVLGDSKPAAIPDATAIPGVPDLPEEFTCHCWNTKDESECWNADFIRIDENSSLTKKDGTVVKGDVLVLRVKDERWWIFKVLGPKIVNGEIIKVPLNDMGSDEQLRAKKARAYIKEQEEFL
ncbi:MAG: hypothetical protein ABSG53_34050, partial [Thermoguttaceae bacterium]